MRFNSLATAIVMLSVLLSSCNSSNSADSPGEPNLEKLKEYKGVANGNVTIAGKTIPIEFIGYAKSTYFDLKGFPIPVTQDTGWSVFILTYWTTDLPAKFGEGLNAVDLYYSPKADSIQCKYEAKAGTIIVDSFIAKKTGATRYFTTSGRSSLTATRYLDPKYSAVSCPDKQVEVTFSDVDIRDEGASL